MKNFLKLSLIAFLCFGVTHHALAAFVLVQSNGKSTGSAAGATTIAQAQGSNATAGNVIVVDVGWGGSATAPSSVVDTRGTTYTAMTSVIQDTGNAQYQRSYCGLLTGSGANTVTVTWAASLEFFILSVREFSGNAATSPCESGTGQFQASPTGTNSITSTALTPAENGALIVGFTQNTNDTTSTVAGGTGFTAQTAIQTSGTTQYGRGEFLEQTTAASIAATFTPTGTSRWDTSLVIIKPAAAAPASFTGKPKIYIGVGQFVLLNGQLKF